jgi:glycosyltransferase involved in cell wall biosynthesis
LEVLKGVSVKVSLTIVGPIEDKEYWSQCQQVINTLKRNITVNYIGPKENQEILDILRQHHLFVLPTEGENFGHSIFEALLSGRPVLISDQTPWQNLASQKAGWDLDLNSPDKFREIIERIGNWSQEEFSEWSDSAWNYAHNFIHNPGLKQPYFELFV